VRKTGLRQVLTELTDHERAEAIGCVCSECFFVMAQQLFLCELPGYALTGWPMLIPLGTVLLAGTFSGTVGIFFGFYPARKAA